MAAGLFLLLGTTLAGRFKLRQVEKLNLDSAGRWAEPGEAREFNPHDRAVMITVRYVIDPDQQQAFKSAMYQ
jgi:hypothetical protein